MGALASCKAGVSIVVIDADAGIGVAAAGLTTGIGEAGIDGVGLLTAAGVGVAGGSKNCLIIMGIAVAPASETAPTNP